MALTFFSVKEFMNFTSKILVERTMTSSRSSVKEQGRHCTYLIVFFCACVCLCASIFVQNIFFFILIFITLGPVVQSVVSLTSSLRVISLTVLVDSIHNILIFFAEKM